MNIDAKNIARYVQRKQTPSIVMFPLFCNTPNGLPECSESRSHLSVHEDDSLNSVIVACNNPHRLVEAGERAIILLGLQSSKWSVSLRSINPSLPLTLLLTTNNVGSCPPIPGLTTGEYFMDFTQQTSTPSDWILADYATVGYGSPNGANFTFAKRYDAPYIWTRFYVLFGHIEVVVQAAPGAGIITSSVMMSDDLDEIDWEWSGNNFASSSGAVQTNYFGKGQIGNSDRGSQPSVDDPEDTFHTYALDWQPDQLVWSIDGVAVRTLTNNGATTGSYQYPQTPSRLHLGLWCSGDPSTPYGTVYWGGGYTNFSAAPFSAYVKSVKITTNNTCSSWQYPSPFDGTYQSVQCTNQTLALPCTYTVAAGDDGSTIANNLTVNFDTLQAANPGVNWDQLLVGQVLNVPGGTCPTSTAASISSTTTFTSTTSTDTAVTSTMSSAIASSSTSDSSSLSTSTSESAVYTSAPSSSATSSSTTFGLSTSTSASSVYTSPSSSSATSSSMMMPAFPSSSSSSATSSSTVPPSYSNTPFSAIGAASTTTSPQPSLDPASAVTATSTSALTTTTSTVSTSVSSTVSTTTDVGSSTTTLPAPPQASNTYTVVAGDYGWAIASSLGCSFDDLNAANPGVDWDDLQIGQTLNIPADATGSSTSTTPSSFGTVVASGTTYDSQWTSSPSVAASASTSAASAGSSATSDSSSGPGSASAASAASSAISDAMTSSGLSSDSDSNPVTLASSSNSATASAAAIPTSTVSAVVTSSSTSGTVAVADGATSSGDDASSTDTLTTSVAAYASPATSTMNQFTSSQPSSISNAVSPVTARPSLAKMVCNQDNCLRNLIDPRYSSVMRGFCAGYTTTESNTAPLPTFLGGCSANVNRVSSACSCLIASFGTGTATSGTPAMTGPPLRAGSPSWKQTPSWKLKRSPLRWNRPAL
ncbi:uncharacterized protein Z520_07150 [Fonsecaea multimorphosa CBS 102226]|uniref:GH16 domain-containing protein n=1 Tax=Fonsecaea multimorphosa CBS 102226 TaxID=1442371 RepID=A0A0D2IJ21_9EURO|nr:uncharacterized protein Z520_07150 [Fonsecaea multimorphosa CBS 102226]KIX97036.1 hypothetical protein Z520_07150 [Fonsecaea multimorphosa CBS 102226]